MLRQNADATMRFRKIGVSRRCSERERPESEIRTVRGKKNSGITRAAGHWMRIEEIQKESARSNRRLRGAGIIPSSWELGQMPCLYIYIHVRNIKDDFPCLFSDRRISVWWNRTKPPRNERFVSRFEIFIADHESSLIWAFRRKVILKAAASLIALCNSIVTRPCLIRFVNDVICIYLNGLRARSTRTRGWN